MNMMLLAGLVATAAYSPPAVDQSHSVRVDHRGTPVEAVYRASVDVQHKQIGMSAPTRMSNVRCTWTAVVRVERKLAASEGASARPISSKEALNGSRPGECMTNRQAIAREITARGDEVREHLVAVAEQDRRHLLAELDAARNLASN